jgi:tRNA (guanine-N7-)-methyltransferase
MAKKPLMDNELIRSFGRLQGRKLGKGQLMLIDEVLPKFSIQIEDAADLPAAFDGKFSKFCVEIGFGKGEHLVGYAKANPDVGFVGCEPFINGVARLVRYIHEEKVSNIRILHGDARLFLECAEDNSLNQMFILFPDPWPKLRHNKKRIINNEMLAEICRVLKAGGVLEVATDHVDYGNWIAEHLDGFDGLKELRLSEEPPEDWVRTNYQEKAEREGRGARFFKYGKI